MCVHGRSRFAWTIERDFLVGVPPCAVASTPVRWARSTLGLGFGFALPAWSMGFGAMLPELRDEVAMSSSVAAIHGSLFGIFLLLFSVVGSRFFATRSNRLTLGIGLFGLMVDSTRVVATLNAFPMASGTLLPISITIAIAIGFSWGISSLVPVAVMGFAMAWCVGRSSVPKDHLAEPSASRLPFAFRTWAGDGSRWCAACWPRSLPVSGRPRSCTNRRAHPRVRPHR